MKSVKNFSLILLAVLVLLYAARTVATYRESARKFEERETLVKEASECLDAGEWKCAEDNVRLLLQESPQDTNLQLHLAGIFFEQERYEECIAYVDSLGYVEKDFKYLKEKSISLLKEMAELGIEKSMHFRVEFEGSLSQRDVMEALAVLEVAYDSLSRLFDFNPENKIHVVLHESEEFQGMGPRPDWVGAVFDGKLRVPVNVMQYQEVYRPMLFHELTHAFVRAMTRAKVPLWLNEGIAQVIDASRNDKPKPEGDRPSLKALTEPFVEQKNKDVAVKLYWYSQKMVEALLYRNGATYGSGAAAEEMKTLRACIQDLRFLETDEALQKHFGLTASQLLERVN